MAYNQIVFWMEIIGTLAFASSGVLVGIDRDMDIFGIVVLALTTAVGGGLLRDLILGITPPSMFVNSIYSMTAIMTAITMFFLFYFKKNLYSDNFLKKYNKLMNVLDALGLAVFTVVGLDTALLVGHKSNMFLLMFVGVITGVGGGVLRDVISKNMPFIFVKQIYAVASLLGCLVCLLSIRYINYDLGLILGALTTFFIRLYAMMNDLNLPRIEKNN